MARNYQRNYEDGGYGSHDRLHGSGEERQDGSKDKGFLGRVGDTINNAWERIAGEDDQHHHTARSKGYRASGYGNYDRGGYQASSGSYGYDPFGHNQSPATDYSSGYTGLYNQQPSSRYGKSGQQPWGGYSSMSSSNYNNEPGYNESSRETGYGRTFMDSSYGSSAGRGSAGHFGYAPGAGSHAPANASWQSRSSKGSAIDYRSAGSAGYGSSSGYGASFKGSTPKRGPFHMDQGHYREEENFATGPFSGGVFKETGTIGGASQEMINRGWTAGYAGNYGDSSGNASENRHIGSSMRSAIYGSEFNNNENSNLTDWAGQTRNFTEGDYGSSEGTGIPDQEADHNWFGRQRSHNYRASKGASD
ncbi:hypothetical protein ACMA1I_21515 [Pontibacter sp. 13R65]|uniref:hypothetical protein n=1 Tax=Pontibacter sp. 13R65 TaxID=3127458 RepID=UPI00301E5790